MKRILAILILGATMFTSCKNNLNNLTTNSDDVYFDPKRDKEAPKPVVEEKTAVVEAAPVQKQEDNNPYYQDPQYNQDDYYDNAYASRLKRFHDPMYGVGYYDSYYTNSYFYNQNPYQYGVSIYNGYNFWGPSYYNYSYVNNYNWNGYYGYGTSMGFSNGYGGGFGYGNGYGNGYSPYGYYGYNSPYCNNNYWGNPYYNSWGNPYYGNPYMSGYSNGYGNGYYNGYNNGYYTAYNNSYDHNSVHYGPRTSHTGSNGGSGSSLGDSKSPIQKTNIVEQTGPSDPTNVDRFNYIPVKTTNNGGTPVKGGNNGYTPHTNNNNSFDNSYNTPRTTNDGGGKNTGAPLNNNTTPTDQPVKGKNWDWNNGGNNTGGNNNNSGNNNNTPRNENWNTGRPVQNADPLPMPKNNGSTPDAPTNTNRGTTPRKR